MKSFIQVGHIEGDKDYSVGRNAHWGPYPKGTQIAFVDASAGLRPAVRGLGLGKETYRALAQYVFKQSSGRIRGLASEKRTRNKSSNRVWESFKKQKITGKWGVYDFLPAKPYKKKR